MNSPIRLSILIPSSRLPSLEYLLESLKLFNHPDVEIIAVINPPQPNSISQKYPWVKVLTSELGGNQARRKALQNAQGEWLWFIDDDCSLPTEVTLDFVRQLIQNNDIDAYAGIYLPGNKLNPFGKAYFIVSDTWQTQCFKMGVPFLLGGNCLIRKKVVAAEYWPAEISFGGAELKLNLEALRNKLRVKVEKQLALVHNIEALDRINLTEKSKRQAKGSFQLASSPLQKLLSFPHIDRLYLEHPLYKQTSFSEQIKIREGLKTYSGGFRKTRNRFTSPFASEFEKCKHLWAISTARRTKANNL